eukprot:6180083-Pleurochrysis_carterae.AAC.3
MCGRCHVPTLALLRFFDHAEWRYNVYLCRFRCCDRNRITHLAAYDEAAYFVCMAPCIQSIVAFSYTAIPIATTVQQSNIRLPSTFNAETPNQTDANSRK